MKLCHWCFREIGSIVKHKRLGWIILSEHTDHALPYSYSHSNAKTNLVTSCSLCNLWKSNRVFDSDDQCRTYLERKWERRICRDASILPPRFSIEQVAAYDVSSTLVECPDLLPVPVAPLLAGTGRLTSAELKTWLITQGASAKRLAAALNLPAWTVRRWELNKRPCPPWLRPALEWCEKSGALAARRCVRCERPLAENARTDTRYCGGKCRTRAYLDRKRVKATAAV